MVESVTYDAQVGVLGSMLLDERLVGQVIAQVRPSDFTSTVYRTIYQAITGLFNEGRPVDILLVKERLTGLPKPSQTLMEIMDLTPTAAYVWDYVAEIKRQAALAALRELGRQMEMILTLEEAQALTDKINAVFSARPGAVRITAQRVVEDFMERHEGGKRTSYLTWSLPKLNDRMYTEAGDLILLGGYPSAGKTALALRFAWHMAKTRRVGFYSLETGPSKLGDRSVAAITGIDMGAIKRSALSDNDWSKLADHAEDMSKCSLDLIPAGGMTVQDIQADALSHRYEIIFLDYVQLVKGTGWNRTEIVTGISIDLHQMAQTHGITVIALSQLSRAKSTASGKESAPTMSSLRESGQLEQDADAVLLLYREKPDKQESRRVLFVAKNKEGGIGKIYLDFDGATQTFQQSEDNTELGSKQITWEEIKKNDEKFPF